MGSVGEYLLKNANVLVYSMARTGSTSIRHTLINAGLDIFPTIHWMQYRNQRGPAEHPTPYPDLVKEIKNDTIRPLKVIIPVREPVDRNVAAYFRIALRKDRLGPDLATTPVSKIQQMMIDNYKIEYTNDWFTHEPMDVFKFNPFELEFNHELGYSIYDVGKHQILFIRLNNYDRLIEALHELLGEGDFKMEHINKFTLPVYEEFRNTPLPLDWVEKNYNLQYAQHFWTKEEREELKNRWVFPSKD